MTSKQNKPRELINVELPIRYEDFIDFFRYGQGRSLFTNFHNSLALFPKNWAPGSSNIECMLEFITHKRDKEREGERLYNFLYWEHNIPFHPNNPDYDSRRVFSKFKQDFFTRHPEFLVKSEYESRFLKMEQMLACISDKINIVAELMEMAEHKKEGFDYCDHHGMNAVDCDYCEEEDNNKENIDPHPNVNYVDEAKVSEIISFKCKPVGVTIHMDDKSFPAKEVTPEELYNELSNDFTLKKA